MVRDATGYMRPHNAVAVLRRQLIEEATTAHPVAAAFMRLTHKSQVAGDVELVRAKVVQLRLNGVRLDALDALNRWLDEHGT